MFRGRFEGDDFAEGIFLFDLLTAKGRFSDASELSDSSETSSGESSISVDGSRYDVAGLAFLEARGDGLVAERNARGRSLGAIDDWS